MNPIGNAIATQLAHTAREPLLAEDRFLLKVHINNLVRSDSIAGAALFVASDDAAFMTGSDLIIDGGYTAV